LKRIACVLVLLALASSAHAAGIALRWSSCEGTANRSFACDRSTGSELLVGSFDPPGGINQLTGIEVILSIASADGSVPSWWQMFEAGNCRRGSITSSFDVSDQSECDDPWNGAATGGMGAAAQTRVSQYNVGDPNGIALWISAAVAASQAQGVSSGRTYAAFKLILNHQKSSGASACSGCDTPVCITLNALRLVQASRSSGSSNDGYGKKTAVYVDLTSGIGGMGGSSQVATWQGGTANCGAGLSKPSTWSELKARFKSK
jgi:hypothetical protein